ncbi:TolC family protein [Bacteroidota bacterium]
MKRIWILCGLLCLAIMSPTIYGQKVWTLEDCIEHAYENNLQVQRQQLQSKSAENNYLYSRAQVLPNANFGADYTYNQGRALNTDDYEWINQEFYDGSVGFSTNLNLFRGLSTYHNIQRSKYSLLAQVESVKELKNDITIQIAGAYLQILFNVELLKIAEEQLKVTEQQVEKNERLVEVGNLSRGDLYDIQAQRSRENSVVTAARNDLAISYLTLAQYMDLEIRSLEEFKISIPELGIEDANILRSIDSVYNDALVVLPRVKAAEYNLLSFEKGLKARIGGAMPSLNLQYATGSFYNQLAVRPGTGEFYPWTDQLVDKRRQIITLGLNIPIFNRLNVQNQISNAKVGVMDAEVALDQTKQILYKTIQQAYADARAALDDYDSNLETVKATEEAFKYTEQRFNVGMVSSVDYNISKNNLTRAQSDLLQAKYLYIFNTKILDFWAGNPITLAGSN